MPANSLTVVVPFYNEERTIGEVARRLEKVSKIFEHCIFINDGSSDNSNQALVDALKNITYKSEILSQKNCGKGSAVRLGIRKAVTSHVAILDADLELEPSALAELWSPIKSGMEMATIGYRGFLSQSSYTYRYKIGNQVLSNFYGLTFNRVVTDVMCGFKVFPTTILVNFPFKSRRFSIEIDILAALWSKSIRPYEIPVTYQARDKSEGKVIGFSDAISILLRILFLRLFLKLRTK